jgi:hypothetical protein
MSENYAALTDFKIKARAHAFEGIQTDPESFVFPSNNNKPELRLTIRNQEIKNAVINCFIQGAGCKLVKDYSNENELLLTISAKTSISNRRRTLYTITAADSVGDYYWFSHLWVNPN